MTNPYAPPQAVVLDVVDPAAGIQFADRSTRLGASILDGLVVGLMVYVPLIVGMFLGASGAAPVSPEGGVTGLGPGFALALAGLAVWLFLTFRCLKANGQSIGKKACGIKIVRRDGSPVSVWRVLWLRNVVNMIIGLVPLYGLIDSLFIFGEARRCIHDHLADTIVIKA